MIKKIIQLVITILIILVTWQLVLQWVSSLRVLSGQTSLEAFIPLPTSIFKTIVNHWSTITIELGYTLIRSLAGLLVGTSLGFAFAGFLVFMPKLRHIFVSGFYGINAFPLVGFAPIIILIFGQGSFTGIIFVSALICFFPTFVQMDNAYQKTNKELLEVLTILHASSILKFVKVQVPLALPHLFVALRLSIPAAIVGATLGEWLGTKHGIGQLVTVSLYQLNPSMLYAALFSLTLASLLSVACVSFLEKKLIPWAFLKE